jgi:transcriptional regulator with XRE-family HTH domain
LIGWSRAKLAKVSDVGGGRITDFETNRRPLSPEAIVAIMRALVVGGIEFDDAGNVVKLREPT